MHYEVCYKIASEENAIFSVGQVYLAGQPKRVAPSDGSSYKITGVRTQWDIADGDQAYGDEIRFTKNCDDL